MLLTCCSLSELSCQGREQGLVTLPSPRCLTPDKTQKPQLYHKISQSIYKPPTMTGSKDEKQQTPDESAATKKTKKPKKREDNWRPLGPGDPFAMLDALPEEKQQELQRAFHLFNFGPTQPRTLEQAKKHQYDFWDTQPVPKLGDAVTSHGPIAEGELSVRTEPYSLPQGFSWDTLDLTSAAVLKELCTLLNENFTEEDDNTVRIDFTRSISNGLCRVHSGCPSGTVVCEIYDRDIKMVQVRLFAAHPLSTCKYWHRPLNPRKLKELNHPAVRQNISVQRAIKLNKLPDETTPQGLRPMTTADMTSIHSLLQSNKSKFDLSSNFSVQQLEHWLLPRNRLVYSYVAQGEDGSLTGAFSFYSLTSKVLNNPLHTELREAQLLFYVSSSADLQLMEDALVLAKAKGFDVFTALDFMDNQSFLENLKFNMSNKRMNIYLYNWQCPTINPDKVGFVLPS
ncbi:hypothetical protein WMY93_010883 [Mugilogobius chulae]|uniref:Glycylpeptide N-tetradecanoyltransferase n=1 Tax=Mugilogobius chulae TaxID=88201 RepID=A0AAW0PJ03_9GOBI